MFSFIQDVSSLTNSDLLQYSQKLANHEKEVGLQIIVCLREAEKRLLYCELGLSSLWEFATQFLGLSNGNAQTKIDAMRLARDNPSAKESIEKGELSILNAAKVNSFFRNERKAGHDYTAEQKKEVIESVVGLSQSQCERALLARSPDLIPLEKVKPITDTKTEIRIVVDEGTMASLQRLKELLSNKMPNTSYAELLDYLVRDKVDSLEKKQMGALPKKSSQEVKPDTSDQATPTPGVEAAPAIFKQRKHISVHEHRWLMRRAQGRCEYIGKNGMRCMTRSHLQIDHIVPLAKSGSNERSNYRVLCRAHNLYYAKIILGNVMNQFIPSLR